MFDELVSSRIRRQVAPMRGLMVGMLHGIVIAGAIRVTARPPETHAAPPTLIVVFDPPRRTPVVTSAPADPGAPADPVRAPELPPVPIDVPPTLPPATPGPPIDPTVLRRMLSSGNPVAGPAGGESASLRGVLAAAEVDEPAVVVHQPPPRYPPVLQQAGLEGRVLLEFIIDTSGHTEAGSLRVLETSNPAFDAAAGETLRRSLFRPARVHGNPVRQRTIQSIAFRIRPE
jgi:periplasmic protein TonB